MTQQIDTGAKTFTASGTIARFDRVKFASDKVAVAGASDVDVGVATEAAAADDVISVWLRTKQGTMKMKASAAIATGAEVEAAASGKIATKSSGTAIGIALEAAGADGDIIEVLRV